jgi:ACT domain-containing protein
VKFSDELTRVISSVLAGDIMESINRINEVDVFQDVEVEMINEKQSSVFVKN